MPAFVRHPPHEIGQGPDPGASEDGQAPAEKAEKAEKAGSTNKIRPDVQAVLNLLADKTATYRQHLPAGYRLNFSYTDLTRDQVKTLYDQFLGSQAGELAIVGDFDPAENSKILQEALSGWTAGQSYARIPAIYFPDVPGVRQEILTPDKANATYMAGLVFPLKESGSDYPAILIGNYVFGGGSLSSRLGDRIRQKEGLSYGVGSALSVDPLDARSSLTIYALCNPKNIEKVNAAINEELTKLLADGVTAAELALAKKFSKPRILLLDKGESIGELSAEALRQAGENVAAGHTELDTFLRAIKQL
ncbi:MAG: insulinase family protein [Proteobacteria bacterium]|nr:insulinase family protein [Pseudomonadota bacterium]